MTALAQCEKTETISELWGRPYLWSEFLPGWESPASELLSTLGCPVRGFSKWSDSAGLVAFSPVFNELEPMREGSGKRILPRDHYPPGGNRACTPQRWFGP